MNKALSLITLTVLSLMLAGCGEKAGEGDTPGETVAAEERESTPADAYDFSKYGEHEQDAREIYNNVVEVIERLRYDDKSGLYENEFQYFREEKTFDDYLIHGEVQYANADSLDHVTIEYIEFFDQDSAAIDATFHILKADGTVMPSEVRWMAYYHQGEWIKPYMSRIQFQLDYEELIRRAEEDIEELGY